MTVTVLSGWLLALADIDRLIEENRSLRRQLADRDGQIDHLRAALAAANAR